MFDFFNQGWGDYEPSSIDDEILLTEVSLDLLKQNVQNQFADPEEYRKRDYVKSFLTKYNAHLKFLDTENYINEDDKEILEERYDDFTDFMQRMLDRYLNVSIPNFEDLPRSNKLGRSDNQEDILHLTYRFFIKDIKKNFINLIVNYIFKYPENIEHNFSIRNDVTYNNFKNEISNETDLIILTNLSDIIEYILNDIKMVDDFLDLCADPAKFNLELSSVKDWYERFELTGNFVKDYIEMVSPEFLDSIESKVRNKILNKYPYRKNSSLAKLANAENDEEPREELPDENLLDNLDT